VIEDLNKNEWREVAAAAAFHFIGAKPLTDWTK